MTSTPQTHVPISPASAGLGDSSSFEFSNSSNDRGPRLGQVSSQKLTREFSDAVNIAKTIDEFLRYASSIASANSDSLAFWIAKRDGDGNFTQIHSVSDDNSGAAWQIADETCRQITPFVLESKQVCSAPVHASDHHVVIAAPIGLGESVEYMLYGCFSCRKQTVVRQQWLMGIFGQSLVCWFQRRQLEQSEIRNRSLNDALTLIQSLDKTQNVRQASMSIVNHLRRLCEADQVSISFCNRPGVGKLTAISDVESVELTSESNKLINHACSQAIGANETLVYPASQGEHSASLLPLEQYCKSNRLEACVNIPLKTESGRVLGALLIATAADRIKREEYVPYLERLTEMISGHLDIVLRANRGLSELFKSQLDRMRQKKLTKTILVGTAILIGAMCIPLPYRVACDCELQPVMRRFIAAPYEGILDSTLAQHGDVVEKDQILAKMDGRQLRIQLAGLTAQRDGAKKKRDSALAKSDYAASQIASSEMSRLNSEIELLRHQVVNLEIRSPIDGIIVSGDLEKVEGAPLEMGQTLFEVGPMDNMLAEVAIPESEISYIETGMDVEIKLNSFPFKNWTGKIEKIQPRAEIINDESVFIAQVQLPNEALLLRPGLKGAAKVRAKAYPIGWNLFHKAWESIRYWTIW